MRAILCEACTSKKLPTGTRQIYAATAEGPAEIQHLTVGTAKQPTAENRYRIVNGVREALDLSHFECDGCGAEIKPGDTAGCQTVWFEGKPRPFLGWCVDYIIHPIVA